jgi:hypothetical protein
MQNEEIRDLAMEKWTEKQKGKTEKGEGPKDRGSIHNVL